MMELELTPRSPEENLPPVDLVSNETFGPPVPPDIAAQRAFRARYGLSGSNLEYGQFYQEISQGREKPLRQNVATDLDRQKMLRKQEILANIQQRYPGKLTPNDVSEISSQMRLIDNPTDPLSVFEENYANAAIGQLNRVAFYNKQNDLDKLAKENPRLKEEIDSRGRTMIAKTEFTRTLAQDLKNELDNQGYLSWGADLAKFLIPLYQDFKLRGKVSDVSSFYGLLGTNLEAQAQELWTKNNFPEFKEKLNKIVTDLRKDNPTAAMMFLSAMMGQSSSDVVWNNAFNLLDVSTLPIYKVSKAAVGAVRGSVNAVQDVAKAATNPNVTKADLIAATGDIGEAAIQRAVARVNKENTGGSRTVQDVVETLFTYLRSDIQDLKANPGRLTSQELLNIEAKYNALQTNLLQHLTEDQKVQRIPAVVANEEAIRKIHAGIKSTFKGAEDNILDMPVNLTKEPFTGVHFVDVNFGAGQGQLFNNEFAAQTFANWNMLKGAKIQQQGSEYYVTVTKPINEAGDVARESLLDTAITTSPDGFMKNFLSGLRTSEDTMSEAQRANRKTATYGPSNLLKLAQEEAKEISKLMRGTRLRRVEVEDGNGNTISVSKKKLWDDFERVLIAGRKMDDPANPGEKGVFFKSSGELDDFYLRFIGRLPHIAETEAYFSYKRYMEMDRILRNISVVRNKSRLGVETHAFYTLDDTGKRVKGPDFDGAIRKKMPGVDDTILIVGDKMSESKVTRGRHIDTDTYDQMKLDLHEGRAKLIEVWDPEARIFQGIAEQIGDARVRYVFTKNVETGPLNWQQVPRRGGGHWEYEYDWYIKQAKIRKEVVGDLIKHWYEGDSVFAPIALRTMGADIAKKLNDVRILIKEGKEAEAQALAEKTIPIKWDEFRGMFEETRGPGGIKHPPKLDKNEPFHVVQKDRMIIDGNKELEKRYGSTFVDGSRHGSMARQYQVKYTGERDSYDLMTFTDVGTKGNPIYNYEPARLVDPVPSMHKSLAGIINSSYMDDYKIFSVEHWLAEAKNFLKADDREINHAPFWHFRNVDWRRDVPEDVKRKLMTQHWQIEQLVGVPSTTDAALRSISQKLADNAYETVGPKGTALSADWILPKLKDPTKFIRSITYHTALGLYAVPQLLTQMQTHFTIQAIAGPKMAMPGAYAAQLYQWMRVNKHPEIVAKLDEYASGLRLPFADNWKPGQWKEAVEEMQKTGFHNVGGEYASLDTMLTPKLVSSGFDQFLDAGTWFFRKGEENVRLGAWFTAYKEFRAKNPTGRITDANRQEILNRADLLNINMSRASASMFNQGVFSVTTQFLTYQIRLAELFFSNRISTAAKARMLATNAALYGAPTATGVFGLPLADFIRQKAVENNYIMGEKYLTSLINEGLPSVMIALATGKGDMQKGTFVNFGDRYGTQGFETINDILRGDKPLWEILGGAAYSKFSGALGSAKPFWNVAMSMMRNDNEKISLTAQDLIDPLKNISAGNYAIRSYIAATTGRWLSTKGIYMTDVNSPIGAILLGLSGLQPQKAVDLSILAASKKTIDAEIKKGTDAFLKDFRRGLLTGKDNPEQAIVHFKNAMAQLVIHGVPEEKYHQVFSRAEEENKTLVDRMNWQYYIKSPVLNKDRIPRAEAYGTMKNIERKQRGE